MSKQLRFTVVQASKMRHQVVLHLVLAVRQVNVLLAKVATDTHHVTTKIAFIAGRLGRTLHLVAQNHARAMQTANQKKFALAILLATLKILTFLSNLSIAETASKRPQ